VICLQALLPENLPAEVVVARGWALLRVEGPFAFDVTGVLAALSAPLADAGVSLLVVATFDTDYLLVKHEQLAAAQKAFMAAGHHLTHVEKATY